MFFQLPDGAPEIAIIPAAIVCVVLAAARVIKNLPRDTISKFFEHRTTKYQIIAGDSKGRVAAMQKQRLVFLGFALACCVLVVLAFINSTSDDAGTPPRNPTPTTTKGS
ncbi:hypothetical protein [Streptomyces sp. GESEQ-4]|uniref:hypothetical protein n=1 Tax=Streptomyces sp. GESEQ-4 TaxID=2812655 RepID=UPI001B34447E|nr:hypothetical protein [Streptomyces sp. GESEQ-4]